MAINHDIIPGAEAAKGRRCIWLDEYFLSDIILIGVVKGEEVCFKSLGERASFLSSFREEEAVLKLISKEEYDISMLLFLVRLLLRLLLLLLL